jgi:hypothetical protein
MNGYQSIKKRQVQWALNEGIPLLGSSGDRGEQVYCPSVEENLFEPISEIAREQIASGDGNELYSAGPVRAKMQALHSSSALPVNIFHYWHRNGQLDAIVSACGFSQPGVCRSSQLEFEKKFKIFGSAQFNPNLDVVFINEPASKFKFFAVESKFTEPYSSRPHGGLSEKYLLDGPLWKNIPNLHQLATSLCPNDLDFEYLHASQLIKHILGLIKCSGGKSGFKLLYLWYDVFGADGEKHRLEIQRFSEVARTDGVIVLQKSYQELILTMAERQRESHPDYVSYITRRYL